MHLEILHKFAHLCCLLCLEPYFCVSYLVLINVCAFLSRALGQTHDSNRTLSHYELNSMKGQTVLFIGVLSYSDDSPFHDNNRWDTGCMGETAGNHEIDFVLSLYGESKPFKPYTTRYFLLYEASCSISPLWYSIDRASAYIVFLSSYSADGKYTPRYKWLEKELPKVNKIVTPWFTVLMHSHFTLYNGYVHHYMEGESLYIRLCTPISDNSAPVYITIGAARRIECQNHSQVTQLSGREASFGHGMFNIKNRTHAFFSWHRNQDGYAVEADSLWLKDRYWNRLEESSSLAVF
ncbi:purple acid phosphatase 2 [Pyrus ussuriensis x Pyrus communis]|uniref:Purple acid phosphatase 2 n=1 Tax=Pyrus ussuriensis x Pyrus communis TaxID=2448454 RepID=A0A5N5HPV7_9ROSA|nr:purple acid phosphatase 2 [Pyrus ussuriensis x Pyrus communis]